MEERNSEDLREEVKLTREDRFYIGITGMAILGFLALIFIALNS